MTRIDRWKFAGTMAVAGVMGLLGTAVAANDNYGSWANSENIVLNTTNTGGGANVATNQTGFPVLIRLAGGNFPAGAKTDGTDIRFAKSDGTHLPYQRERWDNTNSLAEFWVAVDVLGNNNTQYITMYWGNAGAGDSSNGAAVFTTTNGYAAVWHMGDGGTGARADATGHGFNATAYNFTGTEAVPGIIGNADQLPGGAAEAGGPGHTITDREWLQVGTDIADWSAGVTFSCWANPTGTLPAESHMMDFCTDTTGASEGYRSQNNVMLAGGTHDGAGNTNDFYGRIVNDSGPAAVSEATPLSAGNFTAGAWHFYAMTVNGATATIFKDGAQVATATGAAGLKAGVKRTFNFIGRSPWTSDTYYQGYLDELEAATAVRSADWIKLSYQSQISGATWLTFQPVTLSAPIITTQPQSQAKYVGQSVTFTVVASGNPTPTYQWRKNTAAVGGATSSSYSIASIALGDAGTYDVIVANSQGIDTSNGAVLTLCAITQQPQDAAVPAGQPATFTVTVSGSNPTYQWQNSTNNGATWNNVTFGAGRTSATFSFTPVVTDSGEQFRCQITTGCGAITSNAAICKVCNPPVITSNPQNQGVQAGQQVTFTISASAATSSLQWQRSNDNGVTWMDTGSTTSSYTFTTALSDNGAQFRCKAINTCATVYSSAAVLSVCIPASITGNPSSQIVISGQLATFTVIGNANGSGTLTYQWQYSIDGGVTWGPVPTGGTSSTYTFTTTPGDNGHQFLCQVSNGCGSAAVSGVATLTVCTPASITVNPTNQSVVAGQPATFNVGAGGSGTIGYQWQVSTNGGTIWADISGATSATYGFSAAAGQTGYQYHCIASNGCGSPATSSSATLTVCVSASITANPSDQSVMSGQTATFTAAASGGAGLYYQWQVSTDGGVTFHDTAGATSATYSFTAAMGQNGYKYHCGATVPGCGTTVYSTAATLSVCTPPAITANPANQNVNSGSNATFTAAASGSGTINYQWQNSTDNGTTWNNVAGATSATYVFSAATAQNGYLYRAIASNGCGSAAISAFATLTVCSQPAITANPVDISDTAGHAATFTVAATGTPSLFYQWQNSIDGGATWNNVSGAITPVVSFTVATSQNGWKYRCVVSTGCFTPAASAAATLSVCTPPAITQQPVSQPGKQVGDAASFSLALAAEVTSPSYQWQRSADSAKTWAPVTAGSGATTASYSFTVATGDATAQYRCNITNPCGQLYSTIVSIGICTAASIATQPVNQSAVAGQNATFSVVASGNPVPSYQWQVSSNGGATWTNVTAGGTGAAYTITTASNQDGWLFRCTVSNGCGVPANSNSAALAVCTPPQVVSQPGNQDKNLGDTATFGITTAGNLLAYQWQRSADGVTWTNVTGGTGAATATYQLAAAAADNNAKFRCAVQNGCGKDSSAAATLTVCSPPSITGQPKDTSVVTGGTATFRVAFSGTSPAYQWQQSADGRVWTDDSGATSAAYSRTAKASDNGLQFRCSITSKCGSIISAAVTLTVCDPPAITAWIVANDTVVSGTTVVFGVTATGTSLSYRWERKAAVDTAFTGILGGTSASYGFVAQMADSGARYHCVVSAACGLPVTSAAALMTVYRRVRAAFSAVPASGQVPLAVSFYDSSTGNFTSRIWEFGDGTADSTAKNPAHSFTQAGTYTVRLADTGPGGTDTASSQVFAYNPGGNPLQMTGSYVSPQKIRIRLTGFGAITPPSSTVAADSIGLWYTVSAWPQTPSQSAFLKYYSAAALQSGAPSFTDTVAVPGLTGSDSEYGLMTGILWTDKKITPFDSGNGAKVLMRDTMPIVNPLFISGVYFPDDTARIYLDSARRIDTSRVDSVGVWYSLSTDTVNFKDQSFTKWYSASDVAKAGTRYAISIVNSQFNNEQKTMYAAVELHGKNTRYSAAQSTSFLVGKPRPHNPIHLTAHALSATRIRLTWNNVAQTGIERIVIWYRTGAPVPLVDDVTSLALASLAPAVADTVIIGNKFSERTRYFFGAQVYKGGLWSVITDSASATDSTLKAGDTLPYNSAQVTSLAFDTSVNEIKVCWSVNTAQADSLQLGILYSADSLPTVNTGQQQVVDVKSANDCGYVSMPGNILFNHTYYVSLWLRRSDGSWTRPSPAGYDSVHVPAFTWQNVVYFTKQNDTVFAFNNKVRLLNTPGDSSVTRNTLYCVTFDAASLAGFVQAGIGFKFKNMDGGAPFYVGIKVDTIPPGYTLGDVRIFYRTASGAWMVDGDPFAVDSVGRYVYVLTNRLNFPFVAMVDITHPRLTAQPGAWDSLPAGQGFSDTIVVHDHISNVAWHFYAAKGGLSLFTSDTGQSGTLSDTLDTVFVTVAGQYVSRDNGVRAVLYVFDGSHRDSVVLSRSVILDTAGTLRTAAQQWAPLATCTVLDTQDIRSVLRPLAVKGTWKYDNTAFRVFRWIPSSANAARESKWTEYSDSGAARFALSRGTLIWLKTKAMAEIPFGRGITPSLLKSFSLRLPPGNWTDFELPFNFDIALGDIFTATGSAVSPPDSLEFYSWRKDLAGRYRAEAKFISGIDSLNNAATVLSAAADAGFTVYNPCADTISLVIPSLPRAMSKIGLAKKQAAAGGWALRVIPTLADGTALTSVYCGYRAAKTGTVSYYPMAPSLVKAYAGVYDAASRRVRGHAMAHSVSDGGAAFLLVFGNETDARLMMSYRVGNVATLPQGMNAKLYDPSKDSIEDIPAAGAAVTVDPAAQEYRWLFAGTAAYLAKARMIARPGVLRFVGTYPNPFRTFVRIRYSLPYDGVDKVRFVIYDLRGRTVWQAQITPGFMSGNSDLLWDARSSDGRPIVAGVYVISMSAFAKTGKQLGVFDRKMTLLK